MLKSFNELFFFYYYSSNTTETYLYSLYSFKFSFYRFEIELKKLILYKSSKRVSWSNGWGVELEVAHVVIKAIVIPEPNGAQTGVKCQRSLLGSYVNTWVKVLR